MRKIITAAAVGLIVSTAAAAAPDEHSPEAKAYFSFSFGGAERNANQLHYGLRLDHDRYFAPADRPLPPLVQLDFSRRALRAMSVNGLNVLKPGYRVNQDEDEYEEEYEEEEGFFESIGNWFGGLFGDDEEEEEAEEYAEAEDAADEGSADEGYDAIDWGLLAIGLTGIGFATAELVDGQDDDDPRPAGEAPPEGCPAGEEPDPLTGECVPTCDPTGALGGECLFEQLPFSPTSRRTEAFLARTAEQRDWLDSGTGQMGDLYIRD